MAAARGWWEFVRRRVTGLYVARCREWRLRLCFTSPRVLHRLSLRELSFGFVSCPVVSFTNPTRHVGVVKATTRGNRYTRQLTKYR